MSNPLYSSFRMLYGYTLRAPHKTIQKMCIFQTCLNYFFTPQVPPELPEPALGINFARDGMKRSDWLSLVAVHSDSWLMAIAFFNGARLDQAGRRQLFTDINSLPTCYEIVGGGVGGGGKASGDGGPVGGNGNGMKRVGSGSDGAGAKRPRGPVSFFFFVSFKKSLFVFVLRLKENPVADLFIFPLEIY